MFVTNKRIKLPSELNLNGFKIEVVEEFKLLGVVLDNKLTMQKHVSRTCKQINIKLFSIKRLFYLCNSVKLQFFKTFLLPYFDYCLSLSIYFPKSVLQKLSNCFYICLHKLFKFNFSGYEQREINSFLCKYGLFGLEHRLVYKLYYIFLIILSMVMILLLY